MSQITEQQTARNKWFEYRAQEFLLKLTEVLRSEHPDDDDDHYDKVELVNVWPFIMIEAEKLAPVDLERYGGEEFKSFMSQDISVLIDKYPHLLLHARMSLKRQKEDRERKEQKKRKLEESAGGSAGVDASIRAAGGNAGVDAMERALRQARPGPCPRMMSLMYQTRIKKLVEKNRELETAVAGWKSDFEFAQARAAGASGAGMGTGVNARAPARGSDHDGPLGSVSLRECPLVQVLDDKRVIEPYLKRIKVLKEESSHLKKQIQDESEAYVQAIRFANIRKQDMNTEMWLARDKCERTESKNAELHKEISELKVEIAKLKGKRLDLPPHELDELLDVVKETIRKISDQKNLQEVKEKIEGENRFCCPLSTGLFEFPVVAPDGYTYEKEKIEQWIQVQLEENKYDRNRRGQWLSPKTGVLLTSRLLVPNFDIKSLMEEQIHKSLVEMRAKEVSR